MQSIVTVRIPRSIYRWSIFSLSSASGNGVITESMGNLILRFTPLAKGYPARARTIAALVTNRGGLPAYRAQATRVA